MQLISNQGNRWAPTDLLRIISKARPRWDNHWQRKLWYPYHSQWQLSISQILLSLESLLCRWEQLVSSLSNSFKLKELTTLNLLYQNFHYGNFVSYRCHFGAWWWNDSHCEVYHDWEQHVFQSSFQAWVSQHIIDSIPGIEWLLPDHG